MATYNKIIVIGNMTRDPALTKDPAPKVDFGIEQLAMEIDKDGNRQPTATFIDCRAVGSHAHQIATAAKKGTPMLIEGRLAYSKWQDTEGIWHTKHMVVVDSFQFLPRTGCGTDCKCKDKKELVI